MPTRTDLSVLEQEWYLLQASLSSGDRAQSLWWAVALCWQAYIESRLTAMYDGITPSFRDDLRQAGLLGAYNAARRYRIDGCWAACVKMGIWQSLTAEVHRDQNGCWLGKPSRRALQQIERAQQLYPDATTAEVAEMVGVRPTIAKLIVNASKPTLALHLPLEEGTTVALVDMLVDQDSDLHSTLDETIEQHVLLAKLRSELAALPTVSRGLLVDRWGLDGQRPVSVRRLSRRYRISPDAVEQCLSNIFAHLQAVLKNGSRSLYQPPTDHTLQRLVYDTYDNTFLTWREVAQDYELECVEAALRCANEHAHRHRLPRLHNLDHRRVLLQTQVRNEDCYQLAAAGYSWPEVARMASVDDADQAARHARTFARRVRHPVNLDLNDD